MDVISRGKARRWFAAAGVALAVAVAGCTDGTPVEEVRTGGADSSVGSNAGRSPSSPAGPSTTIPGVDPGGTGGSGGGIEPGDPGSVEPSDPSPGGTQPGPDDTSPPDTTIPDDAHQSHQWEGYTVSDDGRTLTFTYYAGVEPCSVFESIVADEGPTTVRVTITERAGPPGVACIMLAQLKSASVTLAAPLGDRQVL